MHVVLYSESNAFGGAESVARLVLSRLPATYRVTVVSPQAEVVDQIVSGVPGSVGVVSPAIVGKHDVRSAIALRKLFRSLDPDLIHFNLGEMAACLAAIVAASTLRDVALLVVEHSGYEPQTRIQQLGKRFSVRLPDGHVAVSRRLAQAIARCSGQPLDRITVIPNGVPEVEPYAHADRRDGRLRLGVVTRLTQDKGVDVLLDALRDLPDAELHIAGDGLARPSLEQQTRRLGLDDRVVFHGWVEDPSTVYRSIDVLVHPSRADVMPMTVIEAMQHGLPVVATNVGGIPDLVIPDVTGFLFERDNVDECRRALDALRDHELRVRLGGAGRARASEQYAVAPMCAAYVQAYLAAQAGARRGVLARVRDFRSAARSG